MIEILKLGHKKYFQNKFTRKYYNIGFLSWKFFLIVNLILMLFFFLFCDSNNPLIQLIQTIISGIFISILVYVATIVIPERNRVERILNTLEDDLPHDLHAMLLEASSGTDHFYFIAENILFPQLIVLEISFGMINREVGILRCSNKYKGLFSYILFLKQETNKLTELLKKSEKDETKIKEKINLIRRVYQGEIIPICKDVRKHYFLDWKNFYSDWKNFDNK